jgi:hypothetical protein
MEYEKFENSDMELQKQAHNPFELISRVAETQQLILTESQQSIEIS